MKYFYFLANWILANVTHDWNQADMIPQEEHVLCKNNEICEKASALICQIN